MACKICTHPDRAKIEQALTLSDYGNSGRTLKDISDEFKLPLSDLQVHALMHTPLTSLESEETGDAIAFTLRKRDADLMTLAAEEYYITMKTAGTDIRKHIHGSEGARISKQMVELYLGAGTNLRQTLESIVNMNLKMNGEQDSGVQALADLVNAIRRTPED